MSDENAADGGGIKVVDRRRFTADGEARPDVAQESAGTPIIGESAGGRPVSRDDAPRPSRGAEGPMDFMTFVVSLATNAMAALGLLPEAEAHHLPEDPLLAREYIDIIAMLQDKTRGNLSRDEDQAMRRLLTDLRMHYVAKTRADSAS